MRKQKSLRALARELGVSHSYLSQVMHGKCPASEKVASALVSNFEASFVTSNPLGGMESVFGGFDSHALPPIFFLTLLAETADCQSLLLHSVTFSLYSLEVYQKSKHTL